MTTPTSPTTNGFKFWGEEPAVVLAVISAALSLLVTLGIGLNANAAAGWVAVVSAVFAIVTAWHTRPIAPTLFTGLVQVVAALLAAYHFNLSAGTVGSINVLVIAVLTLLARGQVTPAATARPRPVAVKDPTAGQRNQV